MSSPRRGQAPQDEVLLPGDIATDADLILRSRPEPSSGEGRRLEGWPRKDNQEPGLLHHLGESQHALLRRLGGSARVAIERAARLGDGWLAAPSLTPAQAGRQLATYADACRALGKEPGVTAVRRDIYVGESEDDAAAVANPILDAGYRGFDPEAPIFGSIDQVAAKFREFAAQGYTDVIIRHLTDDQDKVLASMRRLEEVRKAVR